MRQFRLKNTEKTADNVMSALENRVKKQNRRYLLLFVVIIIAATWYILNALSVREYDGYISHKDIKVLAVNNMAIVDFYVKPGDVVSEGDTLYSFLMIDWLEDQVNPYADNIADEKIKESDLRIAKYESEVIEINNNIDSLQSTIKDIKKEILSGVKTEGELVGLNLELSERKERAKHLKRAIGAEYDLQSKYNYDVSNYSSLIMQSQSDRKANLDQYGKALRHRVAYVDSKIINIKADVGMLTLEHDEVLTFQPIGHPEMMSSHINMIVEARDYDDIYEGMEVKVYTGGEFLCDAEVSLLGVRMAEAYADIESLLDRSTDINGKLIVALKFKEGYTLPEKFYIHNYPVEIRYRVWKKWSDLFEWDNWFE